MLMKHSPKKATPKKAAVKKRDPTPEGEAVDASEYFSKSKSKRTTGTAAKSTPKNTPKKGEPDKNVSTKSTPSGRTSARAKKPVNYSEDKPAKKVLDEDEEDAAEDIFQTEFQNARGGDDDYEVGTDDEDVDMKDVDAEADFVEPDEGETGVSNKSKAKKINGKVTGRKRNSPEDGEESAAKRKKTTPKKPAASKAKKAKDEPESAEMQAIFDSIPLVKPPSPPPKDEDGDGDGEKKKKFNYRAGAANQGPAPLAGTKELPTGQPNCLAGMSFVFTGLLQAISREEGQELVKRHGGKCVAAPSKNTSFIVLGSDAGPSKLKKIAEFGLRTIDEDGLFELIKKLPANGGESKAAAQFAEKQKKEEGKVLQAAADHAAEEKKRFAEEARIAKAKAERTGEEPEPILRRNVPDQRLWTVKYAPTRPEHVCGNKGLVLKIQKWLRDFQKNLTRGFKLPGADGTGMYRSIMIHGPPGIGKTTAAHLVANLEGYDVIETNASDTRSKKLMESALKGVIDTTSINGYFAGDGKAVDASKRKIVLVMDEVDGMSAGDRGGVGALAAVCRKTSVPMILICNDRKLPKMKPFDHVTYDMTFRRPTIQDIRPRLMTICFREGIKVPSTVLDALIEGSGRDIRQVINMLSTAKQDYEVSGSGMDFEDGKKMSKAWEKHIILRPWDIASKILGGQMFGPTAKETLNQKAELYFNDHEFSYLMLQENYLKTQPTAVSAYNGREKKLKLLEIADKAATSISDGDLVDRMIHGPEQHWALMPTHAIFSFVRPASFVSGSLAGSGGISFTAWLGKNSSVNKALRQVKEIQGHMRLRASADRNQIRQEYMPLLWDRLVRPLQAEGKDAVPGVIELMDSYFLTKDDWESLMELGCGPMDMERVKIETQTKSTFSRQYNQMSHPLPFIKASEVQQPKAVKKEKPDIEEALDESDEGEVLPDADDAPDEDDGEAALKKDKYVQAPKKKKAAPKKGKATAKEEEDDAAAPSKNKAKGKGKAKK